MTLPGTWASGAREVERDALARLAHLERELDVALLQAVVVQHVLEAVAAVGNGGDAGAHALGRAVENLAEGVLHRRRAVAGEQLLHALDAQPAGRDLGVEVAAALRRQAHVEKQQIEQLGVELAASIEPHDRDAQALLVDLRHAPRHGAARGAADVGVVREVGHERHQPARRRTPASPC